MGEILPDGSIQSYYTGLCQKCGRAIETNIQGNEIGSHQCVAILKESTPSEPLKSRLVNFLKKQEDIPAEIKEVIARRFWDMIEPSTPSTEQLKDIDVTQEEESQEERSFRDELQVGVQRILRDKGAASKEVFDAINDTLVMLFKQFIITRKP